MISEDEEIYLDFTSQNMISEDEDSDDEVVVVSTPKFNCKDDPKLSQRVVVNISPPPYRAFKLLGAHLFPGDDDVVTLSDDDDVDDDPQPLKPTAFEDDDVFVPRKNPHRPAAKRTNSESSEEDERLKRLKLNGQKKEPSAATLAQAKTGLQGMMKEVRARRAPSPVALPKPPFATVNSKPPLTKHLVNGNIRKTSTVSVNQRKGPVFTDSDFTIADALERKRSLREGSAVERPPLVSNGSSSNFQRTHPGLAAVANKPSSSKLLKTCVKEYIDPGSTAVGTVKNFRLPVGESRINIDKYIAVITSWEATWCKNYRHTPHEEPPLVRQELQPLKLTYESLEEYLNVVVPYIYHEIWANILEGYIELKNSGKDGRDVKECYCDSYKLIGDFLSISLQYVATVEEVNNRRSPNEGDIVVAVVEMEDLGGDSANSVPQHILAFGYICDYSAEDYGHKSTLCQNYPMAKVPKGKCKLLRFACRVKQMTIRLDQRKPIKLQKLLYLRPQLRLIESIAALKRSYLKDIILKPSKLMCKMVIPTVGNIESEEFNKSQNQAILGSLEALQRPQNIAKIHLIQGPPGTGKTHTLIGIIKNIFLKWHDQTCLPKILICAPSNGAVDEVAKRLYAGRGFLKDSPHKRSLRVVRVGQTDSIHPDLKAIALDHLIDANLNVAPVSNVYEQKKDEVETRIAELDQKIANYRCAGQKAKLHAAEEEMMTLGKELDRVKRTKDLKTPNNYHDQPLEARKRIVRDDLLRKADVILSTLNSCRQSVLENIFSRTDKDAASFNCVIIDEASQCSEPELLMPLFYTSISKMILIGDPMQLPATVKSQKGTANKFGRSLFERFFEHFGGYADKENPVVMLDLQYRMHPDICHFPSTMFYDGRLTSHSRAGRKPGFPLKAYSVINVRDTSQDTSDFKNIINEAEAMFITSVCRSLNARLHPGSTVGIITPYQGQRKLLLQKLRQANLTITPDVNTIDGFQGQERDVIIFSSVRSVENGHSNGIGFMGSKKRMNVALTRAKYALIVCVSKPSLETNALWKALMDDAIKRSKFYTLPATSSPDTIGKLIMKQNPTAVKKPNPNIKPIQAPS